MENRLEILRQEMDKLIFQSKDIRKFFSHLYGVSHFCTLLALRRNLDVELATTCGMLHDIANVNGGGKNHALRGAEQAEVLLRTIDLYSDEEIKLIITAISRHSDKKVVHEPYDELLKDADVMSHCLYNNDFSVREFEIVRYNNLLKELGCAPAAFSRISYDKKFPQKIVKSELSNTP